MSSSSSPSEPDSESDPVVRYMRGTTCSRSFAAHAPNVSVNMKGNSRSRSRSLLIAKNLGKPSVLQALAAMNSRQVRH